MIKKKPYLFNALLLAGALVLSIAWGAVRIPASTIGRILVGALPWFEIPVTWAPSFNTIVLQVRLPHTVLVMLSSVARTDIAQKAKEMGFVDYITKPVKMTRLHNCLMTIMIERSYGKDKIAEGETSPSV